MKLLAVAEEYDGAVSARVHPAMVPLEHPLASVRGSYNAVFIEGEAVGQLMLLGRGAGGGPTSSAVLGDLIDAAKNLHSGARGATIGALERQPIRPIDETVVAVLRVARRRRPARRARDDRGRVRQARGVDPVDAAEGPGRRRPPDLRHAPRARGRRRRDDPRGARARGGRAASVRCCASSEARSDRAGARGLARASSRRTATGCPVTDRTPVVTLNEGNTPLVDAPRLSEQVGARVLLKVEGANPTGSFKDRGMTIAISKAAEEGAKVVVCASTGNTSASAAAYAARAGHDRRGHHPRRSRRARQARAGADPRRQGRADPRQLRRRAARRARARRARRRHRRQLDQPVPHRRPEDRGVRDLRRARRGARRALHPGRQRGQHHRVLEGLRRVRARRRRRRSAPRMLGWQAAGSAPLVLGEPVPHPETIATAIRIGNPASWDARDRGPRRVGRRDRLGHRRPDPRRLPAAGLARRRVRRARVGGVGRRAAPGARLKVCSSATRSWCAR